MNFFSNAIAMAKVAAEKGADGLSTLSAKVSEATGVEIPSSLNSNAATTSNFLKDYQEDEEIVEEEPAKFGRIQFIIDYNFDKTTLALTICKCESLPAMDAGGTSDPYVKCWIKPDKKKFCTKKLKKTLNPVFNETFTFLKLPFNEMDGRVLVMAIFDHDAMGSDDQIGECCIPLSSVDLASTEPIWKDIKEPPNGDALGDLCLALRYKPASKPSVLVCQIVQCRNLKQMDLGGASDPYVKVNHMLNGKRVKKYKTSVQTANLNPYWNTSFKIPVNVADIQNIELQIFVNDFDKFGGNDTIGWLNFSLKDTTSAGTHWREAISQPKTNITKWHSLQPYEEEK